MKGRDTTPPRASRTTEELEKLLAVTTVQPDGPLTHLEREAPRVGRTAPWPDWVPAEVRAAFGRRDVRTLWEHQADAAERAWRGTSVVVATGTASGKSLAYQLPIAAALSESDRARALYISPTKALAADQLRALTELDLPALRPATLDGDTPLEAREWVRRHANVILTNPDLLHRTVLAAHDHWATMLRRLRFVVVDECHSYRGVFGAHVALVLRRLRRLCAVYGAAPTFLLASATSSDPGGSASALTGLDVEVVDDDASVRAARTIALWEPPLSGLTGENDAPLRRTAPAEAARMLADAVIADARTLVFVRSRRGAEVLALQARRHLADAGAGELVEQVAAYRGGYLVEDRRRLERDLNSGALLGVATTNALELGVDITGLDAVIVVGFPGTLAALWQQAGRAGRRGSDALVVFIAGDNPLDTYLVRHPQTLFGRPVEATVIDPDNPYVLAPQLCCAAYEKPLTEADLDLFGGPTAAAVVDLLTRRGTLRRRPTGWYWADRERPDVSIRGAGASEVTLVERRTGNLLGTVDAASAPATVHEGAVYLVQGTSYLVASLDLERGNALLDKADPPYTTVARSVSSIEVVTADSAEHGNGPGAGVSWYLGTVRVSSQVVSFQRRRFSGEVIDETPLDLPIQTLTTTAVWYTLSAHVCEQAGLDPLVLPGALHAAEHAAIGLLPLFATCDRSDIGGVSTALHPDTGHATVFVHDGQQGGAGFSRRGFRRLAEWLAATRDTVDSCRCLTGCPSCVQSPKCGNGNEPLDKAGAVAVLDAVLNALRT